MASIEYSQVRKGMVIVGDDGQLYTVVDRDLNTPGNWRAILQLKLKNLKTGSIAVNRVRPQDKVEQAYLVADGREDYASRAVLRGIMRRFLDEKTWPGGGGVQH